MLDGWSAHMKPILTGCMWRVWKPGCSRRTNSIQSHNVFCCMEQRWHLEFVGLTPTCCAKPWMCHGQMLCTAVWESSMCRWHYDTSAYTLLGMQLAALKTVTNQWKLGILAGLRSYRGKRGRETGHSSKYIIHSYIQVLGGQMAAAEVSRCAANVDEWWKQIN